jgi:polyphosphate glucokinase
VRPTRTAVGARRILRPVDAQRTSDPIESATSSGNGLPAIRPRADWGTPDPADDASRRSLSRIAASIDQRRSGTALGFDVGGTGVKGAVVDLATGRLLTDRVRLPTPRPSTPRAVAETMAEVVRKLSASGHVVDGMPVGVGLPGVVKEGRVLTAANIDQGWLEVNAEEVIGECLGRRVIALNDADAAGLAELVYGAAEGRGGTVLMLTIGTGIGTAIFIDGTLLPNLECGHIELNGKDAEIQVSGVARERRGLSWKAWAKEFNQYLAHMEFYFWPDLIIFGGGVSKALDRYQKYLVSRAPIVAATLLNSAGIVGAGAFAAGAGQQGDVSPLAVAEMELRRGDEQIGMQTPTPDVPE